ncbi:class I SAM-dependent methyltransferase [Amycolatopsis orientalis]|uniref:class I SAM-dependent methyltransferase n=1 Tax=Amycolatopsis orientalis TaxID=31958 RepID=UPI00039EE9F0|nr:class I SAM-dependent methyltransferase [Amycolatopsis orientalis]
MPHAFDQSYWDEHWAAAAGHARLGPHPQLVAEAGKLPPGRALDAGCGEGTEAVWLAENGWQVTAVDLSEEVLRHARERSSAVEWVCADLLKWTPNEQFDLVATHYVHAAGPLFERLAEWVAPGGTLLVVGHHHRELHPPEATITVQDVGLDPEQWEITVAENRTRKVHGGELHDTILCARKVSSLKV